MFLWSCRARVSATLQGFHARVILDGAACRLGELGDAHDELGVLGRWPCCTGCAACSCVVVEGRVTGRRWWARSDREVREQQRVRHVRHQMIRLFSGAQRWHCNPCDLSQARGVRSALCEQTVLHRCVLWVGVLSTRPVAFSGILPKKPKSPPFLRWCRLPLAPTRLPLRSRPLWSWRWRSLLAGFPVALCSTAIQFWDRHSNRSFLLRRIADFVVDAVDVVDVSVWKIAAFPPSERLAFSGIIVMHRQVLVAVEEVCTEKIPTFIGGAQTLAKRKVMLYDRIALERHDCTATRAERLQNAKQWILRLNADGPQKLPCENRWMAVVLWLSRFLKHLLRFEEHDLSFRCAVLWSSTGILLDDKAGYWSKVAISFLGYCRTPLVLEDSEVLQNTCKVRRSLFGSYLRVIVVIPHWTDLLLFTHVFKEVFLMLLFFEHLVIFCDVILSPCILQFHVEIEKPGTR